MTDFPNPDDNEFNSELIIGLVSAVGSENSLVIELLTERLGSAGYTVHVVKVSQDVIPPIHTVLPAVNRHYHRIKTLMDAGNLARSRRIPDSKEGGDANLALGIAAQIFAVRNPSVDVDTNTEGSIDAEPEAKPKVEPEVEPAAEPVPMPKTAFIVDSLKRPEEVQKLRLIYPSGFILIGIHEEESRRRRHLMEDLGMSTDEVDDLFGRDSEEIKVDHGQRVNKTFHLADFFVRISDNRDRLRNDIQRMVELWFGNPFITPTFDEHAMFLAYSASLRSADLSRQVGAVVTRDSQILSTGANDCPKAGGGLYWPDRRPGDGRICDIENGRDYKREEGDSNRAAQNRIIGQIVSEGEGSKYGLDPSKLRELLENSVIRDLTEYGRVVHAEMEALLSCSRNGLSTLGTTLYSTTFPCHNCAKHIIAAGVCRVVFVEPYSKSKTLEFHNDSITTDRVQTPDTEGKVKFHAFVGIGPRRFFDLFSMELGSSYPLVRKEKQSGKPLVWKIENARLRIQMKPASYLALEADACKLYGRIQNI